MGKGNVCYHCQAEQSGKVGLVAWQVVNTCNYVKKNSRWGWHALPKASRKEDFYFGWRTDIKF